MQSRIRIGIVGTGFIGKGLVYHLRFRDDVQVSRILTRRDTGGMSSYPMADRLTNSVEELISTSDVVVECSGDVLHATDVVMRVMEAGLPVVTMDAEFQVTTGSFFVDRGLITEAEGDQPGSLAVLREDVLQMGFEPLVYGNIKKYLNPDPESEEMEFWATKQGISLPQVTAFTDGTKVQIEQALAANGLGAGIAVPGLLGLAADDVYRGATVLADGARRLGYPISDYLLSPNSPAGIFIAAEHDECQRDYLRYLKLGDGPYYILLQNYHLCHLEIAKTVQRIMNTGRVLLNNTSNPSTSVGAVAKRDLAIGEPIPRGIGSFHVRGRCVRIDENPIHVPIGLLSNATVERSVSKGKLLTFEDVSLPESLALKAWESICKNRNAQAAGVSQSAR